MTILTDNIIITVLLLSAAVPIVSSYKFLCIILIIEYSISGFLTLNFIVFVEYL